MLAIMHVMSENLVACASDPPTSALPLSRQHGQRALYASCMHLPADIFTLIPRHPVLLKGRSKDRLSDEKEGRRDTTACIEPQHLDGRMPSDNLRHGLDHLQFFQRLLEGSRVEICFMIDLFQASFQADN